MRARVLVVAICIFLVTATGLAGARPNRVASRPERAAAAVLPRGFVPAIVGVRQSQRYIVRLQAPSLLERSAGTSVAAVRQTQATTIQRVADLGGRVRVRFARLINGFSAEMTADAAATVAALPGVASVTLARLVHPALESSVPSIRAPQVWSTFGARGGGMTVAVIDSGVDYTHKSLGGSGDPADYDANDPNVVEPGTFPTAKVIGGWDFVGDTGYDPADDDPTNDTPEPDPDPLDNVSHGGGHGSHVSGICCGSGVPGSVGKGVAPQAKILALKVFDTGSVSSDIVIEAMERAADPNQDGNTSDHVDVINMSLGGDYAFDVADREAAQAATDAGIVVVSSIGNAGNQPNGGPAYVAGSPGNTPAAIGVAASIDQFTAPTISTVPPVDFPDTASLTVQDWGGGLESDLSGVVSDARKFSPPDDPSGEPAASDRALCDATPAGHPFTGKIVLVFKGAFDDGDCLADDKALHAQQAGAKGVILWDGFGGLPSLFSTGDSAASVTIPVVSLSGLDSAALAAAVSPGAPNTYNTANVTATLHAEPTLIPGFEDLIVDFSSEGPTRVSNELKPDVTAPGFNIESVGAGTGTDSVALSGTSMASPHVAGLAALLVQLHPNWTPSDVKAALMNHAVQGLANFDGSAPVSATIMGSGRVDAFASAKTKTLATPGSLSFGLQAVSGLTRITKAVTVRNLTGASHDYTARGTVRFTDLSSGFATVKVSVNGGVFASQVGFSIPANGSATVRLALTLDPSSVAAAEQLFGWYYFNPNIDGNVALRRLGAGGEQLHVPWHVSGLGAARTGVSATSLNLTGGSKPLSVTETGKGRSFADLYLLGAKSPKTTGGEEDIAFIGARSFTGPTVNGAPTGVPSQVDPLIGLTWRQFLTDTDEPTEPVEFGVRTHGVRSTTETQEIDIAVDLGADGVFADKDLKADALLVKLSGPGGFVCLFNLPSTFDACDASYFADYSNFNSTVTGLVVDAGALGLSNSVHTLSYSVSVCDVVDSETEDICDTAGGISGQTGTYRPVLDVTAPALALSRVACRGFWANPSQCGAGSPVTVAVGSAAPGDDPSILALFPNNPPGPAQSAVVTTST